MWLDAAPRRRLAIPSRDLGAGIAVGLGMCVISGVMAASMSLTPTPTPPPPPVTVSIGVLPSAPTPSVGGEPGRAGKPGKPGKPNPSKRSSEASPDAAPDPTPNRSKPSSSSTTKRSYSKVPNPHDLRPGLPGLGELDDPSESGDGGTPGGTGDDDGSGGGASGDGGLGAYRAQVAAWLSPHFHVEGSGLGAKALRAIRVHAVLELSEDRVVLGYQLKATGKSVVDDAARRALEAVKGSTAPAPPPSLGPLQRKLKVVLVCKPDTCN